MVTFRATEDGTRYSSYSVRNQQTPQIDAIPSTANSEDYYALKALPREFVNYGADGDDSEAIDGEVEGRVGETCREVVSRIVNQIIEQRVKLGFDDDIVVEQDVVG